MLECWGIIVDKNIFLHKKPILRKGDTIGKYKYKNKQKDIQ